jgi:ribonuclease Y
MSATILFIIVTVVAVVAALGASGAAIYFYLQVSKTKENLSKEMQNQAKNMAQKLVADKYNEAEEEAKQLRNSARQFYEKVKSQYKAQLKDIEDRQKLQDTQLKSLEKREVELVKKQNELAEAKKQLLVNLEKVAGLSKDEAQKRYMEEFEKSLIAFKASKINENEKAIKDKSQELARQMIIDAMQSVAVEYVDEVTVSTVEIESEEMKGKVIGKEGRNIRAFEKLTGVDVIIDESPTAIGLSSFDPVRREIARIALEKLIKDKRIHPATIEEQVNKAKREMMNELEKAGKFIAEKASWFDAPPEIIPILGRMKFRRSKGQSLYEHTLEVIAIGEYLARELHANVGIVQKACLLHDVGKVLTNKIKKPHHHISGDIARKYNIDPITVNAIEAHHEDIEAQSLEAVIVKIADAVSGARPGARKENVEDYVERLESLEKLVYELVGDKAEDIYAVRAGRELRVVVKPNQVSDSEAVVLAQDIANNIRESGVFPGNVNIVIVRELRAHASTGTS